MSGIDIDFEIIYRDFLIYGLELYEERLKFKNDLTLYSYDKWNILFEIQLYKKYAVRKKV